MLPTTHIIKTTLNLSILNSTSFRCKTTSAQYVASRARDATFEKLMDKYKNLNKVIAIQELILSSPRNSVSIDFLSRLSQKLHLNRGSTPFLRSYPHIFHIFYDNVKLQPFCRLTDTAMQISCQEAEVINAELPLVVDRLVRLLSMSESKSVPLRAVFKVWRELGLPDDFEESVVLRNPQIFRLCDGNEANTHVMKLVDDFRCENFTAAVEDWRVLECCRKDCSVDRTNIQFNFKQGFPPGMRLSQNFKAKIKQWQSLPYVGPYEELREKKTTKAGKMKSEKRAVAIVHEFLNLTVEKMVEVEKISHFRKSFGIDLNVRDLFLDHPGIFYLSTKGKTHTVFLREAYEKGRLVNPNTVYNVRRKLLDLVMLGRHGLLCNKPNSTETESIEESVGN